MSNTAIAFDKTLSLFCKCEKESHGNKTAMLWALLEQTEDREFIVELAEFSRSCVEHGKPLAAEFIEGVLFYQQYLKNKECLELEEWNKSTNV